MATAVLVHGAWQGAWCWQRVLALLDADGHDVVAPTLTGCGSRADLLGPEVDLDTHVSDVVSAIDGVDGGDVVLVGHSHSGMLLPAVAAARAERLQSVVFVDAFHPRRGDSALGLMRSSFLERFRSIAVEEGDGWRLPASDAMTTSVPRRVSMPALPGGDGPCTAPRGAGACEVSGAASR